MRQFLIFLCLMPFCWSAVPIIELQGDDLTTQRASTAYNDDTTVSAINTQRTRTKALSSLYDHVRYVDDGGTKAYPVSHDAVRGVILCMSAGTSAITLYSTTDGQTLTTIASRDDADFAAYRTLAAANSESITFHSVVALDDGSYLASLGTTSTFDPTWTGGMVCSKIYRSTDGGESWTDVHDMTYGYLAPFCWGGIDGDYIVVPTYGPKADDPATYNAQDLHLSTDGGATWDVIDTEPAVGRHLHTCQWDLTSDHTKFYFTSGDEPAVRGIFPVSLVDGVWTVGASVYVGQPTHGLIVNNKIYWTSDNAATPTILEHDPATDTFSSKLFILGTSSEGPDMVRSNYGELYGFDLQYINGLYIFTGRNDSAGTTYSSGIYVSRDLTNWTCLYRMSATQYQGYSYVAGAIGNNLFLTREDGTELGEIITMPTATSLTAARVSIPLTNWIDDDSDDFEGASIDWEVTGDATAAVRSTEQARSGHYSLKVSITDGPGSSVATVYGPFTTECTGLDLTAGDFFTCTGWVKKGAGWPDSYSIGSSARLGTAVEGTDVDTSFAYYPLSTDGWQQISGVVECLEGYADETFAGRFWVAGATLNDNTESCFYLDDVTYTYHTDLTTELEPFVQGVQQAEYQLGSALGAGTAWSISFLWYPEFYSVQARAGEIGICQILGADGSYIDLTWKQSDQKFYAKNGTDTLVSTETYAPMGYDTVRVGIVSDGSGIKIFLHDPINGYLTDMGDLTDCGLTAQPAQVRLGYTTSYYGYGSFARLRVWDERLDDTEMATAFNTIGNLKRSKTGKRTFTAGTGTVTLGE
jgi:hypothetical protein